MTPQTSQLDESNTGRVPGLDALRFWSALWVVFGHLGFLPLIDGVDLTHLAGRVSRLIYSNLASGPAAVIVFFVISGFCVHHPFRNASTVPLAPFFARRYLRILLPVAVAVALSRLFGMELRLFDRSILWSVVCEEVYYALYPLLLALRLRVGWPRMIAVAYLASVILAMSDLRNGDYPSYGVRLNWVLGLPCWMLGCHLAEVHGSRTRGRLERIGIQWWRLGALLLSMLARMMRFHTPVTYPLTLNLFAFYVFFWMNREIDHAAGVQRGWIARAGAFSYSIYLVHFVAREALRRLAIPSLGSGFDWILLMAFILTTALLFYFVVERPSHLFARRMYGRLLSRARATLPA